MTIEKYYTPSLRQAQGDIYVVMLSLSKHTETLYFPAAAVTKINSIEDSSK